MIYPPFSQSRLRLRYHKVPIGLGRTQEKRQILHLVVCPFEEDIEGSDGGLGLRIKFAPTHNFMSPGNGSEHVTT